MSARTSKRRSLRRWLALAVAAPWLVVVASSCASPLTVATERNPADGGTDDGDLDASTSAPGQFTDGASPPLDGGGDGKEEELSDPTDSSTD